MPETLIIRSAVEADAAALLAIYRPFVESTAVSFETVVPTVEEFATRIAKALAGWQWLLAGRDRQRLGHGYGATHRERNARRWAVARASYGRPDHTHPVVG